MDFWRWRASFSPLMALRVAPTARGHDILTFVSAPVRTGFEMFSRALNMVDVFLPNSLTLGEAGWRHLPHQLATIETATLLVAECFSTEFLEFAGHEAST
jgi:hypothetical protein